MISFFHPLSFNGVVLGENLSSLLSKGLSGKSVLITFISSGLRRKFFLPFVFKTSPNPIPDQSQFHQSLPLKTKIELIKISSPQSEAQITQCFFVGCKGNFDISILLFRFFISLAVLTINQLLKSLPERWDSLLRLQQLPRLQPNRKRCNS